MLRTFNESELNSMCTRRPASYRIEILAVATKRTDGLYEVDTDSAAFQVLRSKYIPKPPQFDAKTRGDMSRRSTAALAASKTMDSRNVVQFEDVYRIGKDLVDTLGAGSAFAMAYGDFLKLESRGGCKSCGRRGQLQKLMTGLKISMMSAPMEIRQKIRSMFPATIFFEMAPVPVKWDDLMK